MDSFCVIGRDIIEEVNPDNITLSIYDTGEVFIMLDGAQIFEIIVKE